MSNSANLGLPFIEAAQAQKHVTHNEGLKVLDAVVQLAVLDRDLTAAPGSPANADRYIVATGATGIWSGKDGEIAAFQDGAWMFYSPREGWLTWVADEDKLLVWDGTAWNEVFVSGGGGSVNPTPLVGVNATADATNRLSVSSPASLFNHEGAGHQIKLNKNAAGDTVSLLFQTGFSGRAEMGLAGDDNFHFKVSSDGSLWNEAIIINRATGEVTFPNGSTIGEAKTVVSIIVFDDSENCATGDGAGNVFWRVPSILNGYNLVEVAAQVQSAGTTGTLDIQIANVTGATDMLSTKITIDSGELDSSTAATPAVINTSTDDVAAGDQLRIDVDAIHATPAAGLLVELTFQLP